MGDNTINDAAAIAWPDEEEPFEYEGRTLNRITVDRGNLRYAFAMGANWMAGEPWAQTSSGGPLPASRAQSAEASLAALRKGMEGLAGEMDEDVAARIRAVLEGK